MGDWDMALIPADRLVVRLVPSRLFGTGAHPSTRIALEVLETLDLSERHVLDVGTGTGILAIAAAKLGAEKVTAIDTSRNAIAVAKRNIEINGERVDLQLKGWDEYCRESNTCDLGVSNLGHTETSIALVSTFPGSTLLVAVELAGLTEFQAVAVASGWTVAKIREEKGNVVLRLERNG